MSAPAAQNHTATGEPAHTLDPKISRRAFCCGGGGGGCEGCGVLLVAAVDVDEGFSVLATGVVEVEGCGVLLVAAVDVESLGVLLVKAGVVLTDLLLVAAHVVVTDIAVVSAWPRPWLGPRARAASTTFMAMQQKGNRMTI